MTQTDDTPVALDLGNGNVVTVDARDVERVLTRHWYRSRGKDRPDYLISQIGPRHGRVTTSLHRMIVDAPPGSIIDHINGDTMDNRRSNLRLATPRQNNANCSKRGTNLNLYKGVRLRVDGKRWTARIQFDGRGIHLGSFDTPEEAARAYDTKARELYGPYARCNFPEDHST